MSEEHNRDHLYQRTQSLTEEHYRYELYQRTQSFPLARFQRDILERIVIAVIGDDDEPWAIEYLAKVCDFNDKELYEQIVHLATAGLYR